MTRATSPHRVCVAREDAEQAALIEWADKAANTHPELARLLHIPNGGHRHISVAKKLKGQGVRAGVPDLLLPVPRGPFHGLWIEMKALDGRESATQSDWITFLIGQGYEAETCFGWDAARCLLLDYLALSASTVQGSNR